MKIKVLILLGVFFLSCSNSKFISATDQTYPAVKSPCEARAIIKFDNVHKQDDYMLIGYCEAKASAGEIGNRYQNNAMEAIRECSCENGGTLIKLVSHDELKSLNNASPMLVTPASTTATMTIPLNAKRISGDKIYAAIYRKK